MDTDARLDEILFAYLERLDTGEVTGPEELRAQHPDLADALDERLQALQDAGLLSSDAATESPFPDRLGEFRLLERLGQGGMGVVYLAEQPSLGRRVALKLVRPDQLYFEGARERFRREVEAVASMAHPSIVPVHAVGEERGIPYYAMEHVAGVGLDEVVARFAPGAASGPPPAAGELFEFVESKALARGWSDPTRGADPPFSLPWVSACLWIVREMAEALEHAHQRGVLHRDVKPSNAMLTPAGRLQLLDFGLASTASGGRVTKTGSQPGSLPYMAPEQVHGRADEIDARTDVYGLGVTLYELLALRLPHAGRTGMDLVTSIGEGRMQPLRSIAPHVPRDVETVVATAMAARLGDRYLSAAHFARDLSNLLEQRPIDARPAGPWTQLVRWSQRNRAAAALVVVVLSVAVLAPLLFGLQQKRAKEQQLILTQREEAQRIRAEGNLDQAFAAVQELLAQVGEDRLENVPQAEELRLEFLGTAVDFYASLLERNPGDARLLEMRASLGQPIAQILRELGRTGEAEGILVAHLDELRRLRELDLMPADVRRDLADSLNAMGILQLESQRLDEALQSFEEAIELQREAMALEPDHLEGFADLALLEGNRALVLRTRGDLDACAAAYARAIAAAKEGCARSPAAPDLELVLSTVTSMAGTVEHERHEYARSAELFELALEAQERLVAAAPDDARVVYELERTCVNYGSLLQRELRCERGREVLGRGIELARRMSAAFPARLEFQNALGAGLMNLGELEVQCREPELGASTLREACAVLDRLNTRPGTTGEQRMHAAQARGALGRALLRADRHAEAADVLFETYDRAEATWREQPELAQAKLGFGVVRMTLAELDLSGGGTAGVAAELAELQPLVEHDPGALAELAGLWIDLAVALGGEGEKARVARETALSLLRRAREGGYDRVRQLVDSERWSALRSDPEFVEIVELDP